MEAFQAALAALAQSIDELGSTVAIELAQIADALNKPDPDLTAATLQLVALKDKVETQAAAIANAIPDIEVPAEPEPAPEPEDDDDTTVIE